jgi:SH3-like domain-containing protein
VQKPMNQVFRLALHFRLGHNNHSAPYVPGFVKDFFHRHLCCMWVHVYRVICTGICIGISLGFFPTGHASRSSSDMQAPRIQLCQMHPNLTHSMPARPIPAYAPSPLKKCQDKHLKAAKLCPRKRIKKQASSSKKKSQAVSQEAIPLARAGILRCDHVNWRQGPGQDYPIVYTYQRCKGWPVLILRTKDHWHWCHDAWGSRGWIKSIMVTKRACILIRNETPLYTGPQGKILAHLRPGVLAWYIATDHDGFWLRLPKYNIKGWVPRAVCWPHQGLPDSAQ